MWGIASSGETRRLRLVNGRAWLRIVLRWIILWVALNLRIVSHRRIAC